MSFSVFFPKKCEKIDVNFKLRMQVTWRLMPIYFLRNLLHFSEKYKKFDFFIKVIFQELQKYHQFQNFLR